MPGRRTPAQGRLAQGIGMALRSGAAPLVLGLRWAERRASGRPKGIPAPRRDLALASKIALDEFFFTTELVSATFISGPDRRRVSAEIDEALEFYDEQGWLEEPAKFHLDPPSLEVTVLEDVRTAWLRYCHLRFASEYEPHQGAPGRERWLGYETNRTAHAWLLEHPGRPRPWIVCVPGYRMGHPVVDFFGFKARWLHRKLGLNVAIPVIPLHGPRREGRRGGDGFFTGDFIDTIHAQSQAVWDTRRLVGWLRQRGAPSVGVYGVSLGGYTAALLASLERNLDCVIAGIPATDYVRLVRAHAPPVVIRAAKRVGFSLERIERVLRVISPLVLKPLVPHERRYLYAGIADRLAPPDHARDLWKHWERPRVAWYHGSHCSFLWEPEVKDFVLEALSDCDMLPLRAS